MNRLVRPLCLVLLASGATFALAADSSETANPASNPEFVARNVYTFSKPKPAPKITLDVSDAPEVRPWAEEAKKLAEEWYPNITQILATDDMRPVKTLKLIFKRGIGPPAFTSRDGITIKVEWITQHPDDFGMVIHELTHVVQSYGGRRGGRRPPGWLTEGIADYVRWWRYEPEPTRTPIDVAKAKYSDSYRTTAWFLAWVTGKYDRSLVYQLDKAIRAGEYEDDLFKQRTGKTLDELWTEFVAGLPPMK